MGAFLMGVLTGVVCSIAAGGLVGLGAWLERDGVFTGRTRPQDSVSGDGPVHLPPRVEKRVEQAIAQAEREPGVLAAHLSESNGAVIEALTQLGFRKGEIAIATLNVPPGGTIPQRIGDCLRFLGAQKAREPKDTANE